MKLSQPILSRKPEPATGPPSPDETQWDFFGALPLAERALDFEKKQGDQVIRK